MDATRRQLLRRLSAGVIAPGLVAGLAAGCASTTPATFEGPLPAPAELRASDLRDYRLALVLGSGGPRGFAHVGVLRVLEAEGFKPDLVVGTSMGAVVGALYAAGLSASDIRLALWQATPAHWADDLVIWHKFGWVAGERLQREIDSAVGGRVIEALPTRFVAVAARIPTGERTEFGYGSTGAAVRASAATLGEILPVRIGSAVYADGDLVAPVPVRTARRLGARHVVAIDVSADLREASDWSKMKMDSITQGIMRKQMIDAEVADADVTIRVPIPYVAGSGPEYREYALERGEQAARAALPRLRELGVIGPAPAR